jgi:hypothetical protein
MCLLAVDNFNAAVTAATAPKTMRKPIVLVQREMETSVGGLGSLGCKSLVVVLGFSALVL